MNAMRPTNTSANSDALPGNAMATVRILIASYFLARGVGLVVQPAEASVLGSGLLADHAAPLTAAFLIVTAVLFMAGKAVRPVALALSAYVLCSGLANWQFGASAEALSVFWRDMALLGAVLLIVVTDPADGTRPRQPRGSVAPRRIVPATPPAATPIMRLPRTDATRRQMAVLSGDATLAEVEGEISNIFGDIWDAPQPVGIPSR